MPGTRVRLETTHGQIAIELFDELAPATVASFLQYVNDGFYAGTIFHRVIDGLMIQGGGMDKSMKQKATHAPVANEATNGLKNDLGTLAMARTNDPHSATAQFFINVKNNDFLNHRDQSGPGWGYCVFGKVVEGMDVVDAIKGVATGRSGGMTDVPVEIVEIIAANVE